MFSLSIHSSSGPLDVKVSAPSDPGQISMLTLITQDRTAEVTIFRNGPLALEQILDLGYEIVNAARKLMPEPVEDDDEAEHVPFAINDAIEHEEAVAAMPDGYDPDFVDE